MRYISTRDNHPPVPSASAIHAGMVPQGGLFVPETLPKLDINSLRGGGYRDIARGVLGPLLDDFGGELAACVDTAYNERSFDVPGVIELAPLGDRTFVMELWHGPTAAFKDVALQIMPHFMRVAKSRAGENAHTVILVATSGDTGKAALEGFKDCPGVSIIVFYPADGVSDIQRLQMATTDGANTHVVAVRGNFDDCQNGVKELFGDTALIGSLARQGFAFSSANSINWGRLSPQIVYYVQAYQQLVERGAVRQGEPIDFCVPTGNFGNILAGFYARHMGVPIRRLICASNRNRILADFFADGVYDRNREFFRTMSPSMDILISSNLERFLFEMCDHDAARIREWYAALAGCGRFEVGADIVRRMGSVIRAGWVDEAGVTKAIGEVYRAHGYVLDTHTAVGWAVNEQLGDGAVPVVIDATASPYKFSAHVLEAIGGTRETDEFLCIEKLQRMTGLAAHRAVLGLREKPIRHDTVIDRGQMKQTVERIIGLI